MSILVSTRLARVHITSRIPKLLQHTASRTVRSQASISLRASSSISDPRPYRSSHPRHFQTAAKMVYQIQSMTEFREALEKDIVVTDFFATWCGPCKVIAPKVEALAEEFPDVHFTKVDVDETPDVAQEYGVRAMPTFIIFKNGQKFKEVVGANPGALTAAVNEARG